MRGTGDDMIGFELQRKNMVESQVRPSDITDRRVITAMLAVPREVFADQNARAVAYMDRDLPVGSARGAARRALVAPRTLARMIQAMVIEPGDRVLEIGCATGYASALLGRIARTVVALECDAELATSARKALGDVQAANVKVETGLLEAGWSKTGPYAAILVSGAVSDIPAVILDQLQDGGRLVAIRIEDGISRIVVWQRFGSTFTPRTVGEATAPALPGLQRAPSFVL